ncbi:MAG: glycosyltransferase family 9 protein, partial [Acidobacteriota bacterium]
HIIDIILRNFGMRARDHRCEMYFSRVEEQQVTDFCRQHGLVDGFVVIEPNSKDTWFGDLRAWPFERWQVVVDHLADRRRQVVQVGDGTGRALERVIHLAGKLPVRLSVCLMKRARLFLGIEGGLMHAANAADVPAVIVWGGLTEPAFAAYPERHHVICKHVECAPCGLRGGCPYEKKCLTSIGIEEVVQAVDRALAEAWTRAEGPPS